jgi:hypothetical protein
VSKRENFTCLAAIQRGLGFLSAFQETGVDSVEPGSSDGQAARIASRDERNASMSQYLVLIYEDEAGYAEGGDAVWGEVGAEHGVFGQANEKALLGGNALQPTATATSIRGGTVTDGPFAETKEALGGYYLIEAADLDEAIAVAKQVPARFGGVEVRPIMVLG